MKIGRDRIYGRFLADKVNDYVSRVVSSSDVAQWKSVFLLTLEMYSFRKRKETEPSHEGCRYWLEGIENLDYSNPQDHAIFVMADLDQMFQKDRANRVYREFVKRF